MLKGIYWLRLGMNLLQLKISHRAVRLGILCGTLLLVACGGGSSGNSSGDTPRSLSSIANSSISQSSVSSSIASSSSSSSSSDVLSSSASSVNSNVTPAQVTISGTVTFDFIPHAEDHIGLNFDAIEPRPARGIVVEVLDSSGLAIAQTQTDETGFYRVQVAENTPVSIRARAQLIRDTAPHWNFSVTDNTRHNALYVLTGSLVDSGESNSRRNLHANSGWNGNAYSGERAAAPFAIIDTVYLGVRRLQQAGNIQNLAPLEFRWSANNVTAIHPGNDFSSGEIGTSFYHQNAIYLLGEADVDADEYDPHVILHEWTHYLENVLARTDTLGGEHGYAQHLDMRVALSEGFSNAFAAMILDDRFYRDSTGTQQASGFSYDIAEKNHVNRGWYSEASIESILYHYYLSSNNKKSKDLAYILTPFSAEAYRTSDALTSIYLFAEQLLSHYPDTLPVLDTLLMEQSIDGRGIYGDAETNAASHENILPVYKTMNVGEAPLNICSTGLFGPYNKLGVAQFVRVAITEPGHYQISVQRSGGVAAPTDPDFAIYRGGEIIYRAESDRENQELANVSLPTGDYVIEVYDWDNRRGNAGSKERKCFDLHILQ
jgi:hypothetical protein